MNNLNNSTSGANSGSFSVNNLGLKEMFLVDQQVTKLQLVLTLFLLDPASWW